MENIKDSIQKLMSDIDERKKLIANLTDSVKDMESKLVTLQAARSILESEERSKNYEGWSFKEIVMDEIAKFGITADDFVRGFQEPVASTVAQCLIYGTQPPYEQFEDIAVKTSNLFELNYGTVLRSLTIKPEDKVEEVVKEQKYLIPDDFGGLLTFHMKRTKISQSELGRIAGVPQSVISCWCRGVTLPRIDTLDRIIYKFDISKDEWIKSIEVSKNRRKAKKLKAQG